MVVGYLADVIGDVHALDDRTTDAGYPAVKRAMREIGGRSARHDKIRL